MRSDSLYALLLPKTGLHQEHRQVARIALGLSMANKMD